MQVCEIWLHNHLVITYIHACKQALSNNQQPRLLLSTPGAFAVMPITRRQSGKLPPPTVIDVDADEEDIYSDSSLTELESTDENQNGSGSDWDAPTSRK